MPSYTYFWKFSFFFTYSTEVLLQMKIDFGYRRRALFFYTCNWVTFCSNLADVWRSFCCMCSNSWPCEIWLEEGTSINIKYRFTFLSSLSLTLSVSMWSHISCSFWADACCTCKTKTNWIHHFLPWTWSWWQLWRVHDFIMEREGNSVQLPKIWNSQTLLFALQLCHHALFMFLIMLHI